METGKSNAELLICELKRAQRISEISGKACIIVRVCPPNLAPKAAADKFLWPSWRRLAFKYGLLHAMRYADVLHTVPLFGAIAVRNRYDRKLSLRAGRIWQRIISSRPPAASLERPATNLWSWSITSVCGANRRRLLLHFPH